MATNFVQLSTTFSWPYRKNVTVHTKSRHLNLSSLLDDPGYNFYVVKVKARDCKQESEFAVSPTFSFNGLMGANITCKYNRFSVFILRPFFSTQKA